LLQLQQYLFYFAFTVVYNNEAHRKKELRGVKI
jgi:hypothetical protein